jgi:hypothetical protein
MIYLPSPEEGTVALPTKSGFIRIQDKGSFTRARKDFNVTHSVPPFRFGIQQSGPQSVISHEWRPPWSGAHTDDKSIRI